MALSDTVVVSMVSSTCVVAGVGLTAEVFEVAAGCADDAGRDAAASMIASSLGAATVVVPSSVRPAMTIDAPFASVTVTADCASEVSDAV